MLGWARLGALPAAALGSYLFCFFGLCVGDPVAAAGGWLGQHLLWVHLGGDIAGGNFHFTINHIMCIRREAVRQEKIGCAFLNFSPSLNRNSYNI